MPNRPVIRDRAIDALPELTTTRAALVRRAGRAFRGIPNPKLDLNAIYETTTALKEMVEVLTRQRGLVDDSAILVNEFEEVIHRLEGRIDGIDTRVAILENVIVTLVIAGYGGASQNTDVPFAITGGWTALPFEVLRPASQRGVVFDLGNNTFSFIEPGIWQATINFSIQGHNSSNGGRTIGIRLYDASTGAPAGPDFIAGVGRNVTDTAVSISLMAIITVQQTSDIFQVEVGGYDSLTGGTLVVSNIAMSHVSELGSLT